MRIGVTGGVGCGASEVCRYLQTKGWAVVSGDEAGHLTLTLPEIKAALRAEFGAAIFDPQGEVDRKRLGNLVFADEEARKRLNRIVHPTLLNILTAEAQQAEMKSGIAIVDAALIYEWGMAGFFHRVIVVTAPLETRIARSMARDGMTRDQVLLRMAAQWPLEQKAAKASFVIENTGTLEVLYRLVDQIWEKVALEV